MKEWPLGDALSLAPGNILVVTSYQWKKEMGTATNPTGHRKTAATQRIRIDCESEASHNLIRWLDEPDYFIYMNNFLS